MVCFLDGFLPHLVFLRGRGRELIVCGVWNVAPEEIDR
jgi:exonuclease III